MTRRLTNEEFIDKAIKIHGLKYDYSYTKYISAHKPVIIGCNEHGFFEQIAHNHISQKSGCPVCHGSNILTTEEFVSRSRKIHNDLFDYSMVKYKNWNTKVAILCNHHGIFYQFPGNHLSGNGCPVCANKNINTEDFIRKSKEIHGESYQYDDCIYTGVTNKVTITCPRHGNFSQLAGNHIHINLKMGCPLCGIERRSLSSRSSTDDFISKSIIIHGLKYDYSTVNYVTAKDKVSINCNKHGIFFQTPDSHLRGAGCPKCFHQSSCSLGEKEIVEFLQLLNIDVIQNNRSILQGKELDVFIPEKSIAIEFCGLYWHSDAVNDKNRTYHVEKYLNCLQQNIKLYTIFEDEWKYKKEIVQSVLMHTIDKTIVKIGARKCKLRIPNRSEWTEFTNANHIQGNDNSSFRLGLYHNDLLISGMSFSKSRFNKNYEYEINRFCSKTGYNVPGAASRLFSYFIAIKNPKSVISYADLRYGYGKVYETLGFVLSHRSPPNYWYMSNYQKRESRMKYQKHKLVQEGFDPSKSEWQIMQERGYDRIWDCGNNVWTWNRLQ